MTEEEHDAMVARADALKAAFGYEERYHRCCETCRHVTRSSIDDPLECRIMAELAQPGDHTIKVEWNGHCTRYTRG